MNEGWGALSFGDGTQQGQGNAMIATESNEMINLSCLLLDQGQARRNVPERDGEIAYISEWKS
jgi:hypothetical protein